MKVLLDACVPRPLRQKLAGHDCKTAREMGWAALKNGDLLRAANAQFDVLITSDQNLKYQQNLGSLRLAIIVLPTNFLPAVLAMAPRILQALDGVQPGQLIEIAKA